MTTYRSTQELSPIDASYIAGLVDGEGTVTLQRKHKGEKRALCISISSTEMELLEFVQVKTGFGHITSKRTYQQNHSVSFTYAVFNRQALSLLAQLFPFLRGYKRHRAELILRDYVRLTPRNGKYHPDTLKLRDEFEEEVLSIKPHTVREATATYSVCC